MSTDFADGRIVRGTGVESLAFDAVSLHRVREAVTSRAASEGLGRAPTADLALAVHELATNSVRHGGGSGVLRVWARDGDVHCEVEDRGTAGHPVMGDEPPPNDASSGRGLWIVQQLCDRVDITSSPSGTIVRVQMHVDR